MRESTPHLVLEAFSLLLKHPRCVSFRLGRVGLESGSGSGRMQALGVRTPAAAKTYLRDKSNTCVVCSSMVRILVTGIIICAYVDVDTHREARLYRCW